MNPVIRLTILALVFGVSHCGIGDDFIATRKTIQEFTTRFRDARHKFYPILVEKGEKGLTPDDFKELKDVMSEFNKANKNQKLTQHPEPFPYVMSLKSEWSGVNDILANDIFHHIHYIPEPEPENKGIIEKAMSYLKGTNGTQ